MFHKFFNSEEEKKKKEKREKEKEKEKKEEVKRAPAPPLPPLNDNNYNNDNNDNNIFGPPRVDETKDKIVDKFNTNGIRVDYSSTRIFFEKNTIVTSNNLSNTKYLIKKELGKGAFSNVYLAYAKNENETTFDLKKQYVLKTTKCKPLYAKQAVKEYQYYNKIDNKCKYIIYFKDFFSIPNETSFTTPCLVLEYFHENFYNYMKNNFKVNFGLDINILLTVTKTMVLGIDFLHQHNIIHCDLKPENIVINNKNQCKIIDLGSAIKTGFKDQNCYMQSRYYRSPNCIVSCDINPRIDYWSVGCIMYEALTLIPLFFKKNEIDIILKQLRFIDIPHEKINQFSPITACLYNYLYKTWRRPIEKMYLFDYLKFVLENKNIKRSSYEEKWLFNNSTGYCSLIYMCILDHYNKDKNDYVKQFEIIEAAYKSESKFPSIAAI